MHDRFNEELAAMFGENRNSIGSRAEAIFDECVGRSDGSFVLFGSGDMGRKSLAILRAAESEPIAFADNDSRKWGTSIDGVPVLSPEDAAQKYGETACFIVTILSPGHKFTVTLDQLAVLGCRYVIPGLSLLWKYPNGNLPFYFMDLPERIQRRAEEVIAGLEFFSDTISRQTYTAAIRWAMTMDYTALPATTEYFPADVFKLNQDEVFVDCGAFDGDTIGMFMNRVDGRFRHIVAIEPDYANFQKLRRMVSALPIVQQERITLHPVAVGSRRCKLAFNARGDMGSAASASGAAQLNCERLEDLLADHPPTIVKMDVEGAEFDVLTGAGWLVRRAHCVWAVTTEHKPDDLWTLPRTLREASGDYELFLRNHGTDGFDMYCYATPTSRRD